MISNGELNGQSINYSDKSQVREAELLLLAARTTAKQFCTFRDPETEQPRSRLLSLVEGSLGCLHMRAGRQSAAQDAFERAFPLVPVLEGAAEGKSNAGEQRCTTNTERGEETEEWHFGFVCRVNCANACLIQILAVAEGLYVGLQTSAEDLHAKALAHMDAGEGGGS